jgi:predicted metal-dependent HD superfamily phosphohydrolase
MDGTKDLRLQRLQTVGTELLGANSETKLSKILGAYSAPDRHYHNMEHLDEVLLLWKRLAPPDPILGLALLYHDVVYKSRANDNESQSADWACRDLSPVCSEVELVEQLILDTRHQAPDHLSGLDRRSLLGRWIVDIDLAVLGASQARFDRYCLDVRKEYWWVPGIFYRQKRREVLGQFLNRHCIYLNPAMRDLFEVPARENLLRALDEL